MEKVKIWKYRRTWRSRVDARVELEKQYIKYLLSGSIFQKAKKKNKTKHLLFSVES